MEKILVIVDMQNDFTTGPLGNGRCAAVTDAIIEHLKTASYDRLFLTRDTHPVDYLRTREGRCLPAEHCIRGSRGWEIEAGIMDEVRRKYPDAQIIDKLTFGSVELGETLRRICGSGEDADITFVGVCTGICVLSNVSLVRAFCPEAVIRVIAGCCACVTEETHQTALRAMETLQVIIE